MYNNFVSEMQVCTTYKKVFIPRNINPGSPFYYPFNTAAVRLRRYRCSPILKRVGKINDACTKCIMPHELFKRV